MNVSVGSVPAQIAIYNKFCNNCRYPKERNLKTELNIWQCTQRTKMNVVTCQVKRTITSKKRNK